MKPPGKNRIMWRDQPQSRPADWLTSVERPLLLVIAQSARRFPARFGHLAVQPRSRD